MYVRCGGSKINTVDRTGMTTFQWHVLPIPGLIRGGRRHHVSFAPYVMAKLRLVEDAYIGGGGAGNAKKIPVNVVETGYGEVRW